MTRDMSKYYDKVIRSAVAECSDQWGGLYSRDVARETGINSIIVVRWLRANGYGKTGGSTSCHWARTVSVPVQPGSVEA